MTRRQRKAHAVAAVQDRQAATALRWLTALAVGGGVLFAAGQVFAQDVLDNDLASGPGSVATDPLEPAGIDTDVGDAPTLGAQMGAESAGVGVDTVDGAGVGVRDDSSIGVLADDQVGVLDDDPPGILDSRGAGIDNDPGSVLDDDLGVMTKEPNIAGPVTSQSGEVIDDDRLLVEPSDDQATLMDDLAEDEDDTLGAAPEVGFDESPLDADGAATTTLD